jgi:adenylate cyclase class 2
MPIEHEAKFILTDAKAVRARIIALNGQTDGRFFETNIRFENKKENLKKNGILLRLRKDRKVWLTYKSPSGVTDSGVKSMNEIKVSVSDFTSMSHILEGVGFHHAQIYEKWRETYEINGSHLCLDTMPFGEFLEIEGTPAHVRELSAALGLPWESRVLDNYLTIFARLKQWEDYPFNDLTFDNFKEHGEDLKKYAHLLESGC